MSYPGAEYATPQSSFGSLTLAGVLDDLAARFIVNLPPDELESMDRVCFQIEQAHWYYEDFIRPNASNPSALPSYNLKAFSLLMFKSCPLLHDLVPQHARIWTSFMQYKERVPVCGAVLINEWWDKVLLVKGWNKGSAWSFPRGKINKEEPEAMCAVREVLEETGFDLTPYFPPAQLHPSYVEPEGSERVPYYVELVIREQKIRLYFVPGIKESTRFETRTRKEISKIDWFRLSDLPTWDRDANHRKGGKANTAASARSKGELVNGKQAKFYMVTPFISHLKLWIDRNKPKNIPARNSNPNSPLPRPAYVAPEQSQRGSQSQNFPGGRQLQPWSEDDSTNHLPSDSERTESTAEDDDFDDAFEAQRRQVEQEWTTTQQGTDALQALFFGDGNADGGGDVTLRNHVAPEDSPLAPPPPLHAFALGYGSSSTEPIRPLPVPPPHSSQLSTPNSTHSHATLHATPPQVAYERQQSFVQPKPKQSQNQQTRLLDLLTGSAATPPPPPPSGPPGPLESGNQQQQQHGTLSVAALEQQVHLAGALGNLTLDTPSPLAQQLPLPAHLPSSTSSAYGSFQPSPVSLPPSHADLFSPVAPPAGTGPAAPVFVSDLEESQKQEKRDALLRALLSVAAKSPPKPPPRELEPQAQDARWFASPPLQHANQPTPPAHVGSAHAPTGGGSLLSILNGSGNGGASAPPAAVPGASYGGPASYPYLTPQPSMPPYQSMPHPATSVTTNSSYSTSHAPQPYPPSTLFGPHVQQPHQHGNMPGPPPMVPMPAYPTSQQHFQQQPYISAQPPFQPGQTAPPPPSAFPAPQQYSSGSGGPSQSQPVHPHPHQQGVYASNPPSASQYQTYPAGPANHGLPPMPPPVPIVPHAVGLGHQAAVGAPQQQEQARANSGQLLGLLNGRS